MINIDKFVVDCITLSKHSNAPVFQIMEDALEKQKLELEDGNIVSSRWLKCTRSFETAKKQFKKDKFYRYCATVVANPRYFDPKFYTREETLENNKKESDN